MTTTPAPWRPFGLILLPLAAIAALLALRAPGMPPMAPLFPVVAALALWWLGRAVLGATGALVPALLAQAAPLLSRVVPTLAQTPRPEAMTMVAAALLVASVMPLAGTPDDGRRNRAAAFTGLSLALGAVFTLHFLVLAVVPLLLMDRRRLRIMAGVAVAALALFTLAGLGDTPPAAATGTALPYARAVWAWLETKPLFAGTAAAGLAGLAVYFRLRRRGLMAPDRFARLLAGMLAAQGLAVLAAVGASTASIPALMLTGPCLAALWSLSRPLVPARRHARLWTAVLAVLLAVQLPQVIWQAAAMGGWRTTP